VQWLNWCVLITAAADLALSSVSCVLLTPYVREAVTQARRAAAAALVLINAGMALEAALFLGMAAPATDGPAARTAAVIVVRSVLLGSSVMTAVLLARASLLRR